MYYSLVLNSTNVIGTNKTNLTYNFINGCFYIPQNSKMCLSQMIIPYAWFNINSALYNNNKFTYKWFYGNGLFQTYTVTFPDGFYTIEQLNQYLEIYMISQNQYFFNTSTGVNIYYIKFSINTTYYGIQLITYPIPSSLPTGYTAPTSGFNYNNSIAYGYPNVGYTYTPQINILSTNNFGSLIGFTSGTYPSTNTLITYNIVSNITPNLTPVNSLIVLCDLVRNPVSNQSNILTSIPISNTTFGSNINFNPNFQQWITVNSGKYSSFSMTIVDQNFRTIQSRDANMLITLNLEIPDVIEKPISVQENLINKQLNSLSFKHSFKHYLENKNDEKKDDEKQKIISIDNLYNE